jgi:hypothetical protein
MMELIESDSAMKLTEVNQTTRIVLNAESVIKTR